MGNRGRCTSLRIYRYICISQVSVACMNVEKGGGFSNGSRSYENWENRITLKEANDPLALVGTRDWIPSSVIFKIMFIGRGKMRCSACVVKL